MARLSRLIRDGGIAAAFLFLMMLIAARLNGSDDTRMSGPFHVVDGDTLAVGEERLRLQGIDAPELDQICEDADGGQWACGREAKKLLGEFVREDGVECVGRGRDRYRRLLVRCRSGEFDINAQMVRQGLAVASGGYAREQVAARSDRLRLWGGTFDEPRAWRQARGSMEAPGIIEMIGGWISNALGREVSEGEHG
ncbi:thermonuclease family protein [Rhizobium sp. NTR19]|uniref:Thermonuclease family protein n=1 Tax=Neorhizobium turbinariae TaxID=2937795 RepID=A0ABT0ILA0_9HYPH|nr:thermonuclease family protein [Neorhizobium turbinariae]MCK8778642.1 thermonuclease family protein [Neorhizobium turbinariae]